jgi:AcrR family transcriptional regulator
VVVISSSESKVAVVRKAKNRHAVDGGYARGDQTRARIIAAAIKLFGDRGFEGASTRDIAASASVNAPALQYYFENKEGLYLACAEYIGSRVWEHLSAVVGQAANALASQASEDTLIDAFCAIQAQAAEWMFMPRDADDWRLFMARQQAGLGPAAGFQLIHQQVNQRVLPITTGIVGRLIGRPADDEETRIRTLALAGQLITFQVQRRSALTALDWDVIDAERLAHLTRIVSEQSAALLRSWSAARTARVPPRRSTPTRILKRGRRN